MQLKREFRARKSKEIQGKSLHFLGFLWWNLDFFNALQRIQIKKSFSLQLALRVVGPEPLKRVPSRSQTRQRRV
jgi:hypothetical protein